jgi:hypothetical protein
VIIRQAVSADIERVLEIETASFALGIAAPNALPFWRQLWYAPETFVVGEIDGVVQGYATALEIWRIYDIGKPEIDLMRAPRGGLLYVTSVAAMPGYPGVGRGLVGALLGGPGAPPAIGLVNPKWSRAMRIWQKLGFVPRGVVQGFFHPLGCPAEDGVLMWRD